MRILMCLSLFVLLLASTASAMSADSNIPVPEPITLTMLVAGLAGVGGYIIYKNRR